MQAYTIQELIDKQRAEQDRWRNPPLSKCPKDGVLKGKVKSAKFGKSKKGSDMFTIVFELCNNGPIQSLNEEETVDVNGWRLWHWAVLPGRTAKDWEYKNITCLTSCHGSAKNSCYRMQFCWNWEEDQAGHEMVRLLELAMPPCSPDQAEAPTNLHDEIVFVQLLPDFHGRRAFLWIEMEKSRLHGNRRVGMHIERRRTTARNRDR